MNETTFYKHRRTRILRGESAARARHANKSPRAQRVNLPVRAARVQYAS